MPRFLIRFLLLAALCGFLARPVRAQELVLSGAAGVYLSPMGKWEFTSPGGVSQSFTNRVAVAWGGSVGYQSAGRLGIEAAYRYAPSRTKFHADLGVGGIGQTFKTHQTMTAIRAMYRLAGGVGANRLTLFAGAASISRGGDPLLVGRTSIGATLGATLQLGQGPVAFRMDAENYLFNVNWSGLARRFQNDLVLSGGMAVRIGLGRSHS